MRRPGGRKRLAAALLLWTFAAPASATVGFVDIAPSRGLDHTPVAGSFFDSIPAVFPVLATMQRTLGTGAAVGDYDADGDLDLYLLAPLGQANRLYRNDLEQGSLGFTDVTPAALADVGFSRVAHFVDLDNDEDLDLLLVNDDDGSGVPPSRLFRNDGGGTFTDVSAGSGLQPIGYIRGGAALADYDGDGWIDVYLTNWGGHGLGAGSSLLPGRNRLYRNLGGLAFDDVTDAVGLGGLARDSFSAIFTDLDDDGDPDLYVAVDHSSDEFYRNDAGIFVNATQAVNATHTGNDMGLACADFDDDGDLDLYATNITDPSNIFGTTQGNALHRNLREQGALAFVDVATTLQVEDTHWGWGTQFVDVENDGDLDLVAVTGFDRFVLAEAGPGSPVYQTPSVLFLNDGNGGFTRHSGSDLDRPDDSRALVAFDADRDGDRDLLVTNQDQPVRLFENTSTNQGHWLTLRLAPDAVAIGATARATVSGAVKRRDVVAGRSYLAGTLSELHFGLGTATQVSELRVTWANGSEDLFHDVAADQVLDLRPPACRDGIDNDADGAIDHPADVGCRDTDWSTESPQCQDGINNDPGQDDFIDFDGGLSALGYMAAAPDPQCKDKPWRDCEWPTCCGLGFELALLLPGLMWLRRRRH